MRFSLYVNRQSHSTNINIVPEILQVAGDCILVDDTCSLVRRVVPT